MISASASSYAREIAGTWFSKLIEKIIYQYSKRIFFFPIESVCFCIRTPSESINIFFKHEKRFRNDFAAEIRAEYENDDKSAIRILFYFSKHSRKMEINNCEREKNNVQADQ